MEAQKRKVSILLIIGIIFIPIIFAWFTLRKGYSKKARIFSLGYLALIILFFATLPPPPKHNNQTSQKTIVQEQPLKAETASEPQAEVKQPEKMVESQQPKAEVKQSTVIASEPVRTNEPTKVEEVKPIPKVEQPKIGQTGLKITPEQFIVNYNKEAEWTGSQRIKGFKHVDGKETVVFNFNKDFFIAGKLDENKNLNRLMVGLILLEKNRSKIKEQGQMLLDIGQNTFAALDNNKSNIDRDNIIQDIHNELFNDPETVKGTNSKVASYNQFAVSIDYLPEIYTVSYTFVPRH